MGRAIGAQLAELKKQKDTVAGMSAEKVAQVRRELEVLLQKKVDSRAKLEYEL